MKPKALFILFSAVFVLAAWSQRAGADDLKYANGFETPEEQAFTGGTVKGAVSIDKDLPHGGSASLKIERHSEAEDVFWHSAAFPVTAGAIYRASGWMRFDHVKMPDPSFSPEAHLVFLNAAGAPVSDQAFVDSWTYVRETGAVGLSVFSSDWRYLEKALKAPPGAVTAYVEFFFDKTVGTGWLDDIEVSEESAAAATSGGGTALEQGFLMLWPARAGERGSLRAAGGSFFNPGEPIEWFVQAPKNVAKDAPSIVRWKIKDSLDRAVAEGQADVAAGEALPKVALPSMDAQLGRWLECDWTWEQNGQPVAARLTSLLVLPPVKEATCAQFGQDFNPDLGPLIKRLGASFVRSDIFWRDDNAPTPDAPISWKGLADQRMSLPPKYGLQVLALWSLQSPKWAWTDPNEPHPGYGGGGIKPEALKKAVIETVSKYKGTVRFWQLGNEVGLHVPSVRDEYIADAKAFYEGVKEADPTARVVLGSQTGGITDLVAAVPYGILNYCDIIDLHYGDGLRLKSMQAFLAKKVPTRHIPIWQSEIGFFTQDNDDVFASMFIKIWATSLGEGVQRAVWCGIGGTPYVDEKGEAPPNLTRGSYLGDRSLMPSQLAAEHSLVVDFLHDTEPVKSLEEGEILGYVFHAGDLYSAVIWADGADPVSGRLTGLGDTATVADWTGRKMELKTEKGELPLTCSSRPWLVQWRHGKGAGVAFEETPALLVKAADGSVLYKGTSNELTVSVPAGATAQTVTLDAGPGIQVEPATLDLKPGESKTVTLTLPASLKAQRLTLDAKLAHGWLAWEYVVRPALDVALEVVPRSNHPQPGDVSAPAWSLVFNNHGQTDAQAKVALTSMATDKAHPDSVETQVSVPKGATQNVQLPLSVVPSFSRVYDATAKVTLGSGETLDLARSAGFMGVGKMATPPPLDGDLGSWKGFEPAPLDQGRNYFRYRPESGSWGGPNDLSANFYFGWDEQNLYFAAAVRDDIHFNTQDRATIYQGDSVELAIQPVIGHARQPITKVLFALANGKTEWLSFRNPPMTEEIPVPCIVRRDEAAKITYYEASIPWKLLGTPFVAAPGAHLRAAAMLNENDGTGREAYMSWFGLLTYPTLGESVFTDLTLVP